MLFNSLDFALFLPIVFAVYWCLNNKNIQLQNVLIVAASYVFYGWWDWRFLSLIIFSTLVDYSIGVKLKSTDKAFHRKLLLWTSILVNLGFLGFFKYYNFFIDNFNTAFSFFGTPISIRSLHIILPVGISFYTFQTLSYTIDVYNRKLEPTKDILAFSAFVSFFPQLVAGPIERATNLLPQFYNQRSFNYGFAVEGMRQILWGLFKKMVIADNCAVHANYIFNNSTELDGSTLFLGALFFSFQIYGDFSGYSDIAIGTAKLFGFKLKQNFAFPYFSRNIAEFWRRWHISLSTWFRDYVYIPLGGSRGGTIVKIRNIFIIFIVSGFWHGANWTFIVWGALHALYFLPLLLTNKNRTYIAIVAENTFLPNLKELLMMLLTFSLTLIAWVFFRADNLSHAFQFLSDLFKNPASYLSLNVYLSYGLILVLIVLFIIIEWLGREEEYTLASIKNIHKRKYRWSIYGGICLLIFMFKGQQQDFIYFQF